MTKIASVFTKIVVANLAVLFAIMLLPVFLITEDVAIFDNIMDYLFGNKG